MRALAYENLIRRVHNSEKSSINGAEAELFSNLIAAESGNPGFGLGTASDQLQDIKNYIIHALDNLSENNTSEDQKSNIQILKFKVQKAQSSVGVSEIVTEATYLLFDNSI